MFSSVLEIEIGVITAFSGGLGNIPPGWHLCDGSNGTPDLRDRFVVSAGPTFWVDRTADVSTHTHPFTSDDHTHTLEIGTGINGAPVTYTYLSYNQISGTTAASTNIPPYYALAFIMYLGV